MTALLRVAALPGVPLDVPLVPDAEQGRRWAREELAGPGYERPGLVRRGLEWLFERLQQIPLPDGGGSAVAGIVLLAVLALVVAWAVRRAGAPLARGRAADAVFEARARSAAQHREAADRAAAGQDWRTAVLERFRAVVRELEERAVVPEQPGRTAGETADAAGVRLPALAADLRAAARLFGDVRYGDHDATPAADAALRELDGRVRGARQEPARAEAAGR